MLPFEFVVIGKPISHQTKERKRLQTWKQKVREASVVFWGDRAPLGDSIQVIITHYYDAAYGDESSVR